MSGLLDGASLYGDPSKENILSRAKTVLEMLPNIFSLIGFGWWFDIAVLFRGIRAVCVGVGSLCFVSENMVWLKFFFVVLIKYVRVDVFCSRLLCILHRVSRFNCMQINRLCI